MKTLLSEICEIDNLYEAWNNLNKSNIKSHGLSGESIKDFQANLSQKIEQISTELQDGSFHFSKTRASVIPKDNGKYRPLQIPEIRDRVVIKSIAITLEKELEAILEQSKGVSFAYQKGLGVKDAMSAIQNLYQAGNQVILEADIVNFFGEVDKDRLLEEQVFPKLRDETINNLIKFSLSQEVGGLEHHLKHQDLFKSAVKGIPQGNALSPLLSNVYLSSFDKEMRDSNYGLVRYADDFIILTNTKAEAEEAYTKAKNVLENGLGLKLHPLDPSDLNAKTRIVNSSSKNFSFLSITFDKNNTYPSRKSVDKLLNKINKITSKKNKHNVISLLQDVSNSIDGWISSYHYTNKLDMYFREIDFYISKKVYIALADLGWRFTNNLRGRVPHKFKKQSESGHCLSLKQRKNSGIPLCKDILHKKRKKYQQKNNHPKIN